MKDQFENFIRLQLKNPIDNEIKEILNIFEIKAYAKGEYFKKYDTRCRHIAFIFEGRARHIVINKDGEEVTTKITKKNNLISDIISVRTERKSPIEVKFLEDTEVLVAKFSDVKRLLETNLTLNRIIRENIADSAVELLNLHLLFLTGSAKDRYEFILKNNPSLLKNIPLRFIASIIGITPTQLSRIRKKHEL